MAKEFPVGTIRNWASGDVIKAHDPVQPFGSGWIPLQTNAELERIGRSCDDVAKDILKHKMPINGEKFLDHEIDEFEDKDGVKPFKSGDFKQYFGFYGAGKYAFRNEFSKLFMAEKMAQHEYIYRAYQDANDKKGGDAHHDMLSKGEKDTIKKEALKTFKVDFDPFNMDRARQLHEVVKKTEEQVREGTDFKDPEKKKIYQEFKDVADSLPMTYEPIKVKRLQKKEAMKKINKTFEDNWGVRESCKDYSEEKFGEYVKKYSDRIAKDSLAEQMEKFGVTVDMEPDEFYEKIYQKVNDKEWMDELVGQECEFTQKTPGRPEKKFSAVLKKDETGSFYFSEDGVKKHENNWKNHGIKFAEADDYFADFKELIYLRFMRKYDKSVEGEWKLEHLPAIHNMEKAIVDLPKGHFLTNDELHLITNKDYKGGTHGGYAWYAPGEKRINFSAGCIDRGSTFGVLANPTEFKSVMLHEIGHAVSKKFGKDSKYDYRKFAVECGWTYQSKELRDGLTATGDDKPIPRTGSNSHVHLLTEYAGKAPEEAFAEYYSMYAQNKGDIDKFIETGDNSHLKKGSKLISDSSTSERTVKETMSSRFVDRTSSTYTRFIDMFHKLSYGNTHEKIELVSPWHTEISREELDRVKASKVKDRKDYSISSMPPIVSYSSDQKNVVIDGSTRVEVGRMNKKLIPSITISKELYTVMKDAGYTDHEVANCVYTKNADKAVLKEAIPTRVIKGMYYRDNLVPVEKLQENLNIFMAMKKIYESDELKKAISKMFGSDDINKALGIGTEAKKGVDEKKKTIGTISVRKDGKKYKKVSETGNATQDWKLVTEDKTGVAKPEEDPEGGSKDKGKEGSGSTKIAIEDHAKNSSEANLQAAIKNSPDPEVRQAAHAELDRRAKEEKVQEKASPFESAGTPTAKDKMKQLTNHYSDVVKELFSLEGEDYSTKASGLVNKQNKASQYIQNVRRFESQDSSKDLEDFKKNMGVEPKQFFGDGEVLGMTMEKHGNFYSVDVLMTDGYCFRSIDEEEGNVHMELFMLDPTLDQGMGKGTEIFTNQVKEFQKKGYKKLETLAAKSDTLNGYYTWARLGYDFVNPSSQDDFDELVSSSVDNDISSARSLPELMSFPKGREFWKKNGFEFDGAFDLSENSKSMFILNRYNENKKNGKQEG